MKIMYEFYSPRRQAMHIIMQANSIIDSYEKQGMRLTLRQLYYRFVAGDLFPDSWADKETGSKNTQSNYNKLGQIMGKARMGGYTTWLGIEDRTRGLKSRPHWDSPSEIIYSCASQFSLDKWEGQDVYLEVWFEKDALAGIFSSPCNGLDVSYFSCRGYGSLSELWAAGRRMKSHNESGRKPVVLHFGDHDPSGIDMTRDVDDRLSMFAECNVKVERIALNWDQIEQYDPPPNPAKATDSRYASYQETYGDESWELDALEPKVLRDLVESHVYEWMNVDLFNEKSQEEQNHRKTLRKISENWSEIEEMYGQ